MPSGATALAFSGVGANLVIGGASGGVGELEFASDPASRILADTNPHQSPITCVAASPTGTVFASGSTDRTIVVQLDELQHVTLDARTDTVNALAFSPDGRRLASAGADGTVRIWQLN